ncbi:MAG: ABC transporter permease, partial [Bryobacteraceae bacterium]
MLSVLSQAWRSWKSAKSVALLSSVALAVGIGSTTAIYTVVNAVMLKPLPYQHGERFVTLFSATLTDSEHFGANTFPDLIEYQQQSQTFDAFGWYRPGDFNLTSPGQPQHVGGSAITNSLAHNLGVNPAVGQWFQDETGVVISHRLWNRLGGDRSVVGAAITL